MRPRRPLLHSSPLIFTSNSRTAVKWGDTGLGHDFTSLIYDGGSNGDKGWTVIEVALVRLNKYYASMGGFPVYANDSLPDETGKIPVIGYDTVICVQKYDPWVVEAYNASIGPPSILRIVGKVYNESYSGETPNLNTTDKEDAFFLAHENSINQLLKENARIRRYMPSPAVGPAVTSRTPFFILP